MPRERPTVGESYFSRLGSRLSDWCERWFPDAFIFALLAAILVFIAGLSLGSSPVQLVAWFGGEFWKLIPFTMQMVFIVVGGYVVACSPPVYRLIAVLARVPRTPRGAVAFVAFISTFTSLISYGFSLALASSIFLEGGHRGDPGNCGNHNSVSVLCWNCRCHHPLTDRQSACRPVRQGNNARHLSNSCFTLFRVPRAIRSVRGREMGS